MSEKVGGRPLRAEDLNVTVYTPSDEEVREFGEFSNFDFDAEAGSEQLEGDPKNGLEDFDDAEKPDNFDDAAEDVGRDQKNGDIVLLSVDLDLNRGKNKKPATDETAEEKHGGPTEVEAADGESRVVEQSTERDTPQDVANQVTNQREIRAHEREERARERAEKRAERKQERYENSWRGRREQAKKQEQAQRDSWYETLKKAADAGKTGDWMSREEKVEAGLADDYKGISAEARLLRDLRGDLEEEKGALYEVQRYEFKTPEDVERYAKAAAEVLHYEKNTIVGTQNLEVQFAPGVEETWERRRKALVDEQWQWVKDVLPDWSYDDKRDVQRVYLDFIEYLHEPGNERDSFVDYLEKAVPECKIEPTKRNMTELVVGKDETEKELLSVTNEYGERYYSDEEVAAMLKMYDRAQIMTRYAETVEFRESESTKKETRRHREPDEREGVRSMIFSKVKKTSNVEGKSNIVQFPDDGIDAGAFVATDKRTLPNKISVGNKPISLERFVPNEEGLQILNDLADYCLERRKAAEAHDDEQHRELAEKWKSDYLGLLDNINMLTVVLADRRATQTERQQKELERRAVIKRMKEVWTEHNASEIAEQYARNYDLNSDEPLVDQLRDLYGKFRQGLVSANVMRDTDGQAAYLSAMHELGSVLTELGPDGQAALQESIKEIIA